MAVSAAVEPNTTTPAYNPVQWWVDSTNKNLDQYFANREERYSEYVSICTRIKKAIKQDQIEGGMVGQYNASITQRLNGLTERVDQTSGGEKVNNITVEIVRPNEDK